MTRSKPIPKSPRSARRPPRTPAGRAGDETILLYGIHPVAAALANPDRETLGLRATENAERRLADAIRARGVAVERVAPKHLDRLLGADTVHQGACLACAPLAEPTLADLAAGATKGLPLIVLDQVTDPHNVGAVLRSAAVFDAAGLIMTRRHSPPLNGALAKSASGALEIVPITLVQNLARALDELAALGLQVIGFDSASPAALEGETFNMRPVFVFGAEGKGLRQRTRETCSRLLCIHAPGPITSLNVSNAAAIALYQAAVTRRAEGG